MSMTPTTPMTPTTLTRTIMSLLLVAATALAVLAAPPDAKKPADKPLSFQAVRQLRMQRTAYEKIVEIAKQRRLSFEVNALMEGKLRVMGFKQDLIEQLKAIQPKDEEPAPLTANAGNDGKPEDPAFGLFGKKTTAQAKAIQNAPYGPRKPDAWQEAVRKRIERVNDASGVDLVISSGEHVSIVASRDAAARFLPDVRKLEQMLKAGYPEPIGSGAGLDKRSAYIVLLNTDYDYQKWIKAMFEVYKKDGITFGGQDPLNMALKANSFLTDVACISSLQRLRTEQNARHQVAYDLGYLTMTQTTEGRAPDALVVGFGNVCEVMLLGKPTRMAYSYEERLLTGSGNAWVNIVAQRIKAGQVGAIHNVLNYSTVDMKEPQYAEAWSLTTMLMQGPQQFSDLVAAIRDMQKPLVAIEQSYKRDEEQMIALWHDFANKK